VLCVLALGLAYRHLPLTGGAAPWRGALDPWERAPLA
jgi:hypothetical protein